MQNVNRGHSTRRAMHGKKPKRKIKFEVTTIKPDKRLWVSAMIRASADPFRLLWLDSEQVIVCNSRKHRDYMRKLYDNG